MLMNQILDSSNPARDPDEQRARALKRSASVASLPTPPRTKHKRSRPRARSIVSHRDPDGELDDNVGVDDDQHVKRAKTTRHVVDDGDDACSEDDSPDRKKRRTRVVLPGHDEDEEDENAFWTGRGGSSRGDKHTTKGADKVETRSPSPAMLSYRVKAPVSPPPSRRPPVVHPMRASSMERDLAPVTPPRRLFLRGAPPIADGFKTPTKSAVTKILPERDSPNNPFLVESSEKAKARSEWDSSDDEEEVIGEVPVVDGTPTPTHEEKPTITYVFRGQKATFHNPLYGLAPEVVAASKLPIEHPDYEATEACPPKRLFSAGKRKSRDRSRDGASTQGNKRVKVRSPEHDHDERSEGEQSGSGAETHEKLFLDGAETKTVSSQPAREASVSPVNTTEYDAREERERTEAAAKVRVASRDGLRAGAVFPERDAPERRALGPVRSA